MTHHELLEKALYSSATIHQPHSLKAYLSAKNLYDYLGQPQEIWAQTSHLINQSELKVSCVYSDTVQAPKFSELRIERILRRGIYPAAYQALVQWHENKGFNDIFSHYVSEASKTNEYLSHNVTILLALNCAYKELESSQIPAFLNRFAEFVTSTFSGSETKTTEIETLEVGEVLQSCLNQFGFFGHNLISLAWILRCKDSLSPAQYSLMLSNLYSQANTPPEDPDDEINLSVWELCEQKGSYEAFTETVGDLVFDYSSNLHQITLADALCFLQKTFPANTSELRGVAEYQCRMLEK